MSSLSTLLPPCLLCYPKSFLNLLPILTVSHYLRILSLSNQTFLLALCDDVRQREFTAEKGRYVGSYVTESREEHKSTSRSGRGKDNDRKGEGKTKERQIETVGAKSDVRKVRTKETRRKGDLQFSSDLFCILQAIHSSGGFEEFIQ